LVDELCFHAYTHIADAMKHKQLFIQATFLLLGVVLVLLGTLLSQRYKLDTIWGEPDVRYSVFQGGEYREFETMRLLGRQCPSCSGWW